MDPGQAGETGEHEACHAIQSAAGITCKCVLRLTSAITRCTRRWGWSCREGMRSEEENVLNLNWDYLPDKITGKNGGQ